MHTRRSAADPQCSVPRVRSLFVCDGQDAPPWLLAGCWWPPTLDAGPAPTPELAGQAIVDLAADDGHDQAAYVLTAAGLRSLS